MTNLKSDAYENRGAYGDSFGMITSLFSSLTFFLVLYGIYYQRKEMSTQNEMLNLSKRQHYFDRAYAFLEKNLTKLKEQEITLLAVYKSLEHKKVIACWEKLTITDLNNTNINNLKINTDIEKAIEELKTYTENKLAPYSVLLTDVDCLIKKFLGDTEINTEDYGCLMEVIKLQLNKDFRSYISTTLKFYNTYVSSELFQNEKIIKKEKDQEYKHEVDSESKYYNLQPIIRMKGLFT